MISHILLNVSDLPRSEAFYLATLEPLNFRRADFEPGEYSRLVNGQNGVGLNHFALAVPTREGVDRMERHLQSLNIPLLGDGKTDLEYRKDYYTLAYEDPDRFMIEIVHHDPFYFSPHPDG